MKFLNNYSLLATTLLLLFITAGQLQANPESPLEKTGEFTKKFSKTVTLDADDWVNLKSKWGNIHVNTHPGKEVRLEAHIGVDAFDKEEAQRLLDLMTVDFREEGSQIYLEADIRMKMDKLYCKDDEKIIWPESGGKIRVRDYYINITVQLPRNNHLRVEQTYNDFHLGNMDGNVDLDMKYANVNIGKLGGAMANLELRYTRGQVESIKNGQVEGSYSSLDITKAETLNIDTRYNEFEIGEVEKLDIDDMYNEYEIGTVRTLTGSQRYGDVEIDQVLESVSMSFTYGDVSIADVHQQFSSIKLDGKYIDCYVEMPRTNSCSFELTGKWADIDLPRGLDAHVEKSGTYSKVYSGQHGNGGGTILTDIEYGDFNLRFRHHLSKSSWNH